MSSNTDPAARAAQPSEPYLSTSDRTVIQPDCPVPSPEVCVRMHRSAIVHWAVARLLRQGVAGGIVLDAEDVLEAFDITDEEALATVRELRKVRDWSRREESRRRSQAGDSGAASGDGMRIVGP